MYSQCISTFVMLVFWLFRMQQTEGIKMNLIRRNAKLASVFLAILMLSIRIPFDSVWATMVGTKTTLDSTRAQQDRDKINKLLLSQDIQDALIAQGIDPVEAKARIDSLSYAEVVRLADQIDKIPAGAGPGTTIHLIYYGIIILAIIVSIVLGHLIHSLIHHESSD